MQRRWFATKASDVYDVLICGGGIVGSTLACLLKSHPNLQHHKIGIIEPQTPRSLPSHLPDARVYTITPNSQHILQSIDVWDQIPTKDIAKFQSMQVWDTEGPGFLRFHCDEVEKPELGMVVENQVLQNILYKQMEHLVHTNHLELWKQKVQRFAPSTQQDPMNRIVLEDGTELISRLIVAADGANSMIRAMAKMGTWGWEYDQQAIVATVQTDRTHDTAWQRFLSTGPVALLPIRDGYSSIVWSCTPEKAEEVLQASSTEFLDALNQAFHAPSATASPLLDEIPVLSQISKEIQNLIDTSMAANPENAFVPPPVATELIGKRFSFPLKMKQANAYTRPGIALIGDAAHSIHPLAGQGLNLGIADAKALGDVIIRGLECGQSPGSEVVLDEYEQTQKAHNVTMGMLMDSFKRIFGPMPGVFASARNWGMGTLNAITPIKAQMIRFAMGIDRK